MSMKKVLALAAAGEAATGLALLIYPALVVRLLLGAEVSGAGAVISRIAGISLIALGLACLPSRDADDVTSALRGMLTYNLLATPYLIYLGIGREWVGTLLWPALAVHAALTIVLARAWLDQRRSS
jgi:hypothetical protein